jgi:preprotein translocase subunit SecA
MISNILTRIFGSRNERLLKQYSQDVRKINALEPTIAAAVRRRELAAKTPELKQRVANGESLDDVLPEAFAVVREASKRVLQLRHFDVQLIGGMVASQRQDRGNAHGGGQNPRRDAARVPERAVR